MINQLHSGFYVIKGLALYNSVHWKGTTTSGTPILP